MDKKTLLQIGIIVIGLIMIVGMFPTGSFLFGNNRGNTTSDEQIIGTAEFDATLSYYQPYLAVAGSLTDKQLKAIRQNEYVEEITQEQKGFVIISKSRENVTAIYSYLKSIGIDSQSLGTLTLPSKMSVKTSDGKLIEIESNGRTIDYQLFPVFEPGTKLRMTMIVVSVQNKLAGFQPPVLKTEEVELNATGNISKLLGVDYTYTIPWENRNNGAVSAVLSLPNASVDYSRKDSVSFVKALTINETIERKKLPYVIFITSKSATISANFTDKAKLLSDFGITNESEISFPNSILKINSNASEGLELPFEKKQESSYLILLPSEINGMKPDKESAEIRLETMPAIGSEIPIKIKGQKIGDLLIIEAVSSG